MPARKYTELQRLAFMALIDRGGSVRAAAAKVGVHPDAGYKWMKRAGLSTSRSTQRRYSAGEKAEFLRRLAVLGNVSAVAREFGFNRVTCYVWAHKAGIFTAEYSDAKRQEFLALRGEGSLDVMPPPGWGSRVIRRLTGTSRKVQRGSSCFGRSASSAVRRTAV